jgi:radical SAM superfamily enzyme YgiQ (UPF0313 family)
VSDIVLTTLNARYAHASFGLRYLMANLGELQSRATMLEFDINQRTLDILEVILSQNPRIVGIGVYIWNATQSLQLVAELKRIRPEIIVILGGPEVSYETDQQEICRLADFVVTGEGDLAFAQLCKDLLSRRRPLIKIIPAELPEFEHKAATSGGGETTATDRGLLKPTIALPYDFYTDTDISHRVIYIEASRGCPFKCEFCLSSLDVPVRNVPLDPFLSVIQKLLDRGVRNFKFVDRTFNLNLNISKAILQFFLERLRPGLFLHFEMIPDRLPEALRAIIKQFPPGMLQFEVGVQTFNEEVSARISRKQDNAKLADNLHFLRNETGVHIHTDLIVGLPGEDIESFGAGFDRLVALRPQEIQVGMLKRLRGTPIVRHDSEFGMVYAPHAPYEILQTRDVDFATMQRLRRFSRYWDLIANSGNFVETTPLIWESDDREIANDAGAPLAASRTNPSPFQSFLRLSDWIFDSTRQTHAIALQHLAELIFRFLTTQKRCDPALAAQTIWRDYQRVGRSDRPEFLKPHIADSQIPPRRSIVQSSGKRQARHSA